MRAQACTSCHYDHQENYEKFQTKDV
ncbi:hypothetical protein [Acinetobacter nosocomialis]